MSMTKLRITAVVISPYVRITSCTYFLIQQLHNHIDNHQIELCIVNLLKRLNKLSQFSQDGLFKISDHIGNFLCHATKYSDFPFFL